MKTDLLSLWFLRIVSSYARWQPVQMERQAMGMALAGFIMSLFTYLSHLTHRIPKTMSSDLTWVIIAVC